MFLCMLRKTDPAEFTDWMFFLSSIVMEEIGSNPEAFNVNT